MAVAGRREASMVLHALETDYNQLVHRYSRTGAPGYFLAEDPQFEEVATRHCRIRQDEGGLQ